MSQSSVELGDSFGLSHAAGALRVDCQGSNSASEPQGHGPAKDSRQGFLHRFLQGRLSPAEFRRRLLHIAPGLLPLILLVVPHRDPVSPTLLAIMTFFSLGISALALVKRQTFGERLGTTMGSSVLGYAGIVLAMLWALQSTPELGLAVMGILAFGDGLATLAGVLFGTRRLPWNPQKSWAGFCAFHVGAIPMATLIYWGEAQPGVSLAVALGCALPAAIAGAIAESLPSKINDNIRVGAASAVTILIAHAMFVGLP
jgi:phytol kinase